MIKTVFFLAAFVLAGCARKSMILPEEIAGIYTFESANEEWAFQSGIAPNALQRVSVVLRPDGTGEIVNLPMGKGVLASSKIGWVQIRPKVLDLRIADPNVVMPVEIVDGELSYSVDPEFTTNLKLKKGLPRPKESTSSSG